MRVFCSGGAGFISSHIIDALIKKRHKVFFVDNFTTSDGSNLLQLRGHKNIHTTISKKDGKIHPVDIIDVATLRRQFEKFKPRTVFHLAAQPSLGNSWNDPRGDALTNILGTIALIDCAIKYGVYRFVFASTSAVYEEGRTATQFEPPDNYTEVPLSMFEYESHINPSSPYGLSKATAERYIRMFFPNHFIFRLGNVYGPRQVPIGENQLIPRAIKQILGVDEVTIKGEGEHTRDFIYVDDVVTAFMKTLKSGKYGTYNVCSGQSEKVTNVLSTLKAIAEWDGDWADGTHDDPRLHVRLDNSKYKEAFKIDEFTPLGKGLRETFAWWKEKEKVIVDD